jgi:hypothetical protein
MQKNEDFFSGGPAFGSAAQGRDYMAAARGSDLVVIRVIGLGNMLQAPALQEFAEEQIRLGFKRFVFDLERCRSLDSTFMGVMVGIHLALIVEPSQDLEALDPADAARELRAQLKSAATGTNKGQIAGAVSAVNATAEVAQLMNMLGVDRFVKMRGSCELNQLETTILPEKSLAPEERHQLILAAHENLVEIDKRNEAKFGPLLKALSQALEK